MCDGRRKEGTRSRSGRCVKHVQLRQNRVQNFRLDHVQTGGGCAGVGVWVVGGGSPFLARLTINTPVSQTEWFGPSPPPLH